VKQKKKKEKRKKKKYVNIVNTVFFLLLNIEVAIDNIIHSLSSE
jgi:hypothetical protein